MGGRRRENETLRYISFSNNRKQLYQVDKSFFFFFSNLLNTYSKPCFVWAKALKWLSSVQYRLVLYSWISIRNAGNEPRMEFQTEFRPFRLMWEKWCEKLVEEVVYGTAYIGGYRYPEGEWRTLPLYWNCLVTPNTYRSSFYEWWLTRLCMRIP